MTALNDALGAVAARRDLMTELGIMSPLTRYEGVHPSMVMLQDSADDVPALLAGVRAVLALRHGPFGPWGDDLVSWDEVVRALSDALGDEP